MDNESQPSGPEAPQEPTVLDLFKSITRDWSSFFNFIRSLGDVHRRDEIHRRLEEESIQPTGELEGRLEAHEQASAAGLPWRSLLALFLALYAQLSLEPPGRNFGLAVPVYFFACGLAVWASLRNEWRLPMLPATKHIPDPLTVRTLPLFVSIALALMAFWDFGTEAMYTATNVSFWVLSILLLVYGLWLRGQKRPGAVLGDRNEWFWLACLTAALGLAIFFRLNRIETVPAEPFSDHAEKIMDIYEITQGKTMAFFPRNTGREGFQMYWTLLVAGIFGTGLTFLSLKLGTVLLGLLTLPFIYLLGNEFSGKRAGLLAMLLFGIAYWPNLISRIGLRFPLYPLFVAPCLYYLVRGLRTRSRNDFILTGFFLGLGLHGYSPFRIMPLLVLVAFGLYLLHAASTGARQQAVWWLVIIMVVSLVLFLPLLRYSLGHPGVFSYRAFSRLGNIEAPLPGPAWQIFSSNLWRGLLMFNWDDGEIWVNSVPLRPALDVVTAALFLIGVVLLAARAVRERDWRDVLLLVSIPVLLLPSVLSLAFPAENPALNRAAGAVVPAILISALALDGFLNAFPTRVIRPEGDRSFLPQGFIRWALVILILAGSAYQNYDLVFRQFDQNFRAGAWNTSEMGKIISDFRSDYGRTDTVWIVPYPHWVDTRLPGIWAGIPNRDFAVWPEQLAETLSTTAPRLFIFNLQDLDAEKALTKLYPQGVLTRYTSATAGKDFYVFFVQE